MITKLLVSAAVVLGAAVGAAAPAMADPSPAPSDGIGSAAMNCVTMTDCAQGGLGTAPTVNLNDVAVAFKGSASDLNGF